MKENKNLKVAEAFKNAISNGAINVVMESFEGSFSGSIHDKLLFVNPNRIHEDKKLAYQKVSASARNLTKKVRELKGALCKESRLLVGTVDPFREYILGGVLEEGTAIVHNSVFGRMRKYASENGTVEFGALRSPTCGEFYKGMLLSQNMFVKQCTKNKTAIIEKMVAELKSRCERNGKDVSDEQIAHICKRRFQHCLAKVMMLDTACITVTGSEYFKSCTGGSDFDTDKFAVFVGEDLIFFNNRVNFSVSIPSDMGEAGRISWEGRSDMFNKAFHSLLSLTTTTVDEQMVLQSRIVALISTILTDGENKEKALNKIRENLKELKSRHSDVLYVRKFRDDENVAEGVLSNEYFKAMFNEFVACDRSDESILNYLLDCVHIGAAVGGMTIDMAKTALDLFSPFMVFMDGISQKRRSQPSSCAFIPGKGIVYLDSGKEEK